MPGPIGRGFHRALVASRLPPLLHRLAPRQRVTVLAYHAVVAGPLAVPDRRFLDATTFRLQAEYLAAHFDVVPLPEAVQRLQRRSIRRPTAALTFDVGFHSVHEVALPVLKRLSLPATVFLTTGLVDSDDTPWFCRINRAVAAATRPSLEWRGEYFELGSAPARARAAAALQDRLSELAWPLMLREMEAVVGALGDDARRPIGPGSPYRVLGQREIEAMAASGLVEFGSHGASPAPLAALSREDREREVTGSVSAVARLAGRPCRLFAYPGGRSGDSDLRRLLAESGIQAAVTTSAGPNLPTTPRLELRRYFMDPDMTLDEFQLAVHHVLAPGRAAI